MKEINEPKEQGQSKDPPLRQQDLEKLFFGVFMKQEQHRSAFGRGLPRRD
jgi:hypothetical protein